MRTVHFPPVVAIAATAILTAAGSIAAQEASSGLLNSLEVRALVARAEPADHARLGSHFTALADRYTAEARRHVAMSRSFVGNPNCSFGGGMSVHCKQLAELNTQSAATARELAAYHQKLAGGTAATRPRDTAGFEAGAGAPAPTDKELDALAARAATPAEHRSLQEYFLTAAKRYAAEAREHAALAQTYRGTRIAQAAVHHDRLAGLSRDAANEATAGAEMHEQLANIAR